MTTEPPVFVVGLPRSGSTLSEQIIGAHPQVKSGGEQPYFQRVMQKLGYERQHPDMFLSNLSNISSEDGARIAEDYLAGLHKFSRTAERVTDKMLHNFEHLWLIALLFPNATFILCSRDPMDNCVSCFASPLKEFHSYTADLSMLGRYYRLQHQLNQYWRETLPVDILDVRYEDLIRNPEQNARKLVSHAELEWDEACLRFHERGNVVQTLSSWQVRQPIYTSAVGRWKNYDAHLEPLKEALGDLYTPPTTIG